MKRCKNYSSLFNSLSAFFAVFLFLSVMHVYYLPKEKFRPEKTQDTSKEDEEQLIHPKIQQILSRPFTFLNQGKQCYAFLSQDQTTVLKFLKKTADPKRISSAYKLAFDQLKNETGLLFLHLNKSKARFPKPVTLIDNRGKIHQIALDETQFILQKKADLVFPKIKNRMKNHDLEGAERLIDSLFVCLKRRCQQGIGDTDCAFQRNIGFFEEEALIIDVGSFLPKAELKNPAKTREELIGKTERLRRFLKKHYPELFEYYEEQIKFFD